MNKCISGHEFRNISKGFFFPRTINEKYILFAGTSVLLQDMNLQLFNLSNTTATEGLRQPNTFLTNTTPVTKAHFSTTVLPIKASKRDIAHELHLIKT